MCPAVKWVAQQRRRLPRHWRLCDLGRRPGPLRTSAGSSVRSRRPAGCTPSPLYPPGPFPRAARAPSAGDGGVCGARLPGRILSAPRGGPREKAPAVRESATGGRASRNRRAGAPGSTAASHSGGKLRHREGRTVPRDRSRVRRPPTPPARTARARGDGLGGQGTSPASRAGSAERCNPQPRRPAHAP